MDCLLALGLSVSAARAEVFTWQGNGYNEWWSTTGNFSSPVTEAATATLLFTGNNRLTENWNTLSAAHSIIFGSAAGAFTLKGNGLNVYGDITNASSNTQTVDFFSGLILKGGEHYFDGGSGGLVINSDVTLDGPGVNVAGMGWSWMEMGLPATANFLHLQGKTRVNGAIGEGSGGVPGVLVVLEGGDVYPEPNAFLENTLDFSNATKLTHANTHSGGTVIGVAVEFSQGSLGTGPVSIEAGGVKWATGNTQDISSQFVTKTVEVQRFEMGSGGMTAYTEDISVAAIRNAVFDTNGQDVTLNTPFYAEELLMKQGLGTLTMSGRSGANYLMIHEGVLNLVQSGGTGGLGNYGYFGIVNIAGGLLQIGAGAQIEGNGAFIGSLAGKSGGVEVGFGDWRHTSAVYIGTAGSGSLSVGTGGVVEAEKGVLLALDQGSQGVMTVDGGLVNATSGMIVGSNGAANVVIKNGATVNVGEFSWGFGLGGDSYDVALALVGDNVDVSMIMDLLFQWAASAAFPDKFYIGGNPEGSFNGIVGLNAGITGSGTVAVQGGSRLTAGAQTFVGYTGNGVMNLESLSEMVTGNVDIGGSKATYQDFDREGTTYRALLAPGTKGTGTVRVDNATWLLNGMLNVGSSGSGTLEVRNGGEVVSGTSVIGSEPGGDGAATVTGTNSGWVVAGELRVGGGSPYQLVDGPFADPVVPISDGFSGSLAVQNGGLVSVAEEISIAYGRQSTGVATVNGGTLTTGMNLHVGRYGTGTLNLGLDGGVYQSAGFLGTEATGFGTANVTGGLWSGGSLTVGRAGQGILNISGGLVSTGTITFGELAGSGGALSITSGTLHTTGNFFVSQAGGASLAIGGGLVSVGGYTEIARQAGNTVAVEMTGGRWANTGNFSLGTYGTGNFTMSGGHLSADGAYIGDQNTGVGNLTVVSGTFQASNLHIGSSGTGTLNLSANGVVSQGAGILGTEVGGLGMANVTGGTWSGNSLTVGHAGVGILTVSGGLVSTGAITFGELAGSGGALSITSGTLHTSGNFIASQAGGALLAIGGGLVSVEGYTEIARQAGNTVAVEMTGGRWANTGNFSLGTYGTGNFTMSGGHLSTDGAYIGDQNTGVGNLTVVSGTFQASHLYIGSAGTGSLSVSNTGLVKAVGTTLSNYGDSDGTVTLSGNSSNRGVLETGSLCKGSGNGSFVFNGGVLRAGQHHSNMITGFAPGEIDIQSGGAFINSNGYSIGIGAVLSGSGALVKQGTGELALTAANSYTGGTVVNAGTLLINDLGNTTSVLGSGIVIIETGGTLKGTGTVLGDTTVHGTLAPGNSPGSIHFAGGLTLGETATTAIELASPFSFDQLYIDGALSYGGTLSLTLLGEYRPEVNESFTLFFANNVTDGTAFDHIIFNIEGYSGILDYEMGQLTITAVPEPSTFLFGLAGVAVAAAAYRRRR